MWIHAIGGQAGILIVELGQMAISPEVHQKPNIWQFAKNFLRGERKGPLNAVASPVISGDVVEPVQDSRERDKLLLAQREALLHTMEEALEPTMREEAEKIRQELESKGTKRGLMLIIDDSPEKIMFATRRLAKHAQGTGLDYVIHGERDGVAGIVLFREFKRIAPSEKVVVFIDGQLRGQVLDKGYKVAQRLVEVTRQKDLAMPFVVGESSTEERNDDVRSAVDPAVYLGEFSHLIFRSNRTLSAIDEILSAA